MDETKELKEKICEALEPEEIQILRQAIKDKEEELEDLGEFEISERECDNNLDDIYPEVDIAGVNYTFSNVLKAVDEVRYYEFKNDMESSMQVEQEEVLGEELSELKGELDELLEANEDGN